MPQLMNASGILELIGKIVFLALGLLFFVVVFVFIFHLYANRFLNRNQETSTSRRRRRHADISAAHHRNVAPVGLDPSVLKRIPVIVFDPAESGDELECSVCLSEISKGEKARLLPKCSHGFHLECIDLWFQSHSTCPLCRNPVAESDQNQPTADDPNPDPPRFPTNVLIWGNENEVVSTVGHGRKENLPSSSSSSSPETVVIDVSTNEDEEAPKSPLPTRMRSFKSLLESLGERIQA